MVGAGDLLGKQSPSALNSGWAGQLGWALWDHAFGEVLSKTDEIGNETDEVGNQISEVYFKILSPWGNKSQPGN